MRIAGLQKTTLLDYPGCVAATIFISGCNMRCGFCQNMNLVDISYIKDENASMISEIYLPDDFTIEEIMTFLKKRKGILDGVCITGGEPTLNFELYDFVYRIKELGYKIKLDTNGTNPQMLKKLVSDGLLNYVAMDIKTAFTENMRLSNDSSLFIGNIGCDTGDLNMQNSPYSYAGVCGKTDINEVAIRESANFLINSFHKDLVNIGKSQYHQTEANQIEKAVAVNDFDYEFRTTVIKQYHNMDCFEVIGRQLKGARNYYLQGFVDSYCVPDHSLSTYDKNTLEEFAQLLRKNIRNVQVRGL